MSDSLWPHGLQKSKWKYPILIYTEIDNGCFVALRLKHMGLIQGLGNK